MPQFNLGRFLTRLNFSLRINSTKNNGRSLSQIRPESSGGGDATASPFKSGAKFFKG